MTSRRSMPSHARSMSATAALLAAGLALSACTVAASPGASGSADVASPSGAASSGPASPSPAATKAPSPSPVSQTDTAWGRIWDAVPASFPLPPGASPVTPERAASGAWSLTGGDPAAITSQIQAGLEKAGYSTAAVSGPLEDGSRIIDSVGTPSACHIQTRVKPLGGTISITVMFGASCPFR